MTKLFIYLLIAAINYFHVSFSQIWEDLKIQFFEVWDVTLSTIGLVRQAEVGSGVKH